MRAMSLPITILTSLQRELAHDRARELVEEITRSHGFLDETTLSTMEPGVRRKVEEAMLRKDEMIGSSVITLAKNLYNSSARFVFELLQNADDNSYSRARSLSAVPFVSFHVYHQRIVVECNEDGFTRENLTAICNVGKSSKTGAQGYIGEKGIGFKSVFMVAWKVHIQSGDFSFYFQHRMGDSGMGMITPVWEDAGETLARPLTRITLFLHDAGSNEILDRQQETTLEQFRELQATFLLFMKNLQRIDVTMYDSNDVQVSSTAFSMERQDQNRVKLERKMMEVGNIREHTQHYHITKDTASGLPKSENRTYTTAELSSEAYAAADVVLAFPLTPDSVPIVEAQDVFAFLPIRNMGFPFLIHSDFVTDASRQDLVRNSARNDKILRAIGEVFVKAVSQFCENPTMRYRWMRYLPSDKNHLRDTFWTTLTNAIHACLQRTPVLWTRRHEKLRSIKFMRRIPQHMLDENGEPLFPDTEPEEYLAPEYSAKDLDALKNYGLRWLDIDGFLVRVRKDLNPWESSIIKSPETGDDWHSRVAKILFDAWPDRVETMKSLALIPLKGGQWKSASDAISMWIYYPNVNEYQIPTNLKLNLLVSKAARNCDRKRLFDRLGVQEPRVSHIRYAITIHHGSHNVALPNNRMNLEFLYLTAHLDQNNDYALAYRKIKLFDHMHRKRSPEDYTFYFPGEDPYGAQQLFRPVDSGKSCDSAPDLDVSFLHSDYMSCSSTQPDEENRTWRTWLSQMWYVRDVIPLTCSGRLSEECLYVAKQRPEKFLGFLLKCWKSEGSKVTESQAQIHALLSVEVLCENGNMHPLGSTYVHAKQLEYGDRFIQEDEPFPWLKQEASLSDVPGLSDLEVLTGALGFGYPKSELEFYLTLLRFIKNASEDAGRLADVGRVYELYGRIESRYHESVDKFFSRKAILEAFRSESLIYVPAYFSNNEQWTSPECCLWEAPADMLKKCPLKWRYRRVKDTKHFVELFRDTLAIPDAGIYDFLDELEVLRQDVGAQDPEVIYELYRGLDLRQTEMDTEIVKEIRERFERCGLIYYEDEDVADWYTPSECLWSTVTDIKGMVALNSLYEDMQDLFVGLLGVRTLTLEMVYDKLVEQATGGASIHDVKETIWLLNSYLQDEGVLTDPKRLIERKIFPVRYPNGTASLCSSTVDFAIKDRKHLSDLFSSKAKVLDFEVNDTPRLEPFLRWTGLETRYLSSCVKEISGLCDNYHQSLTFPDRKVARKAHALLRIAVHFRSPRAIEDEKAFYDLLQRIDVRETDGISSEVHLNQDGNDISVEVSRSELHLQENKDGLTIYVPREKQSQYLCFLDRIPRALLEWIMTNPITGICEPFSEKAVNIVHTVLQAQDPYVALILDRAGILSVETPDDQPDAEFEITTPTSQSSAEQSNVAQTPESSTLTADVNEFTTTFSRASHTPPRLVSHYDETPRGTQLPHTFLSSNSQPANQLIDSTYRGLLHHVVAAARETVFPAISHSLDSFAAGNYNEDFWIGTMEKVERDKRIGAAGELFVFEVLSRLNPALPGFSRDNWESTIRKYVRLHDEYSDMQPWHGRETADFTYTDTGGVFTSLLIEKGYLCPDIWSGKRPKYYLEVKSTTGSWDAPFYMSKYQYQRAQNISHDPSNSEHSDHASGNSDAIYVIFRVFNLSQDSIGIKIYVDPDVMRQREELSFTAETWSIVPGPCFGNPES